MKKYPCFVYRCPGSHSCPGGTYDYQLVEDYDELELYISDGWFPTLPEAMEGKLGKAVETYKPPIKPPEKPPTRAEMETQASMLGVKFTKKTTDDELLKMINEAMNG